MAFSANANMVAPIMRSLLIIRPRGPVKSATTACFCTSASLSNIMVQRQQAPLLTGAGPTTGASILLAHRIAAQPLHTAGLGVGSGNVSLVFDYSLKQQLLPSAKRTMATGPRKNIVVPPLAESLSEGDIKFEKSVGDIVVEDDLLASIETDKTSIPINSPVAGKVVELLVEDSSTVKPGQNVMVIDTEGASSEASSATKQGATAPQEAQTQPPPPSPAPQPMTMSPQQQAPLIDSQPALTQQKSSISVESVKSELSELSKGFSAGQANQRAVSSVKMNRMRLKIASRLKEAQNTYAMLTTFNEIDMSNLMEMRQRYKDAFLKKHNVKLGFMSAFVKASAYALKDQPVVNAVIEDNHILYHDYVDISVAVATPKGLVVPVLRDVDTMNFADVEKRINQLGEKAKNNALTVADMEGGTFTISNGGVFGSLFGTPIINPPQSAILGMHAIKEKPVAVNGQVVIRPVMVVALTYDHRLIDGREAVTFLKKIVDVIEDPRLILLDL